MVDNMKRELRMSIYVYFRSGHLSLSTVETHNLNFGCDVNTEGLSSEFPPRDGYCDVKAYCTLRHEQHIFR